MPPRVTSRIYQFTTSSAVAGYLAELALPLIIDYHNFTGPEHLRRLGAAHPRRGRPGRPRSSNSWRRGPLLGLAVSSLQRAWTSSRRLPSHGGRAGARRLRRAWPPTPDPRVAGELRGAEGERRHRHPLRRPCRAVEGPTRAGQSAVGLPAPRRPPGRVCTSSAARRASTTSRRSVVSPTTSDSPRRCGSPARCPTPRWPRTSAWPMCTSRSRCTRVSASRSSRRWLPVFPSWPGVSAPYARQREMPRSLLDSARPVLRRCGAPPGLHGRTSPLHAGRGPAGQGWRTSPGDHVAERVVAAVSQVAGSPWLRSPSSLPATGPRWWAGAESAARAAGRAPARPHGLGVRGSHDLRARPPHLAETSWRPATPSSTASRSTATPSDHGRLPDFYGLDGCAAPGTAPGHEGSGSALGGVQRARSRRIWSRRCAPPRPTSWPSIRTCTTRPWPRSVRSVSRRCSHPAAHDEPALYLRVFRGTFGDADAICYHTVVRAPPGRADLPGGRAPTDRPRARHRGVGGGGRPGGEVRAGIAPTW